MMAAHAKNLDLLSGSIITTGTANAQVFSSGINTSTPLFTAVPTGLRVLLKIGAGLTNTATMTLNMDGVGDILVKSIYGNELSGGEIAENSLHEFVYNGTNWVLLVNPAATVLLAVKTASNSTSVDFTGLFAGNYTHYIFDIDYVLSTDDTSLAGYLSTNNGASWASDYFIAYMFVSLNSPSGMFNAGAAQTRLQVGPTLPLNAALFRQYTIMDLMIGGYQSFRSFGYAGTIGNYHHNGSGFPSGGIVPNAFRFQPTGGTIVTGTFRMYGTRP